MLLGMGIYWQLEFQMSEVLDEICFARKISRNALWKLSEMAVYDLVK